MKLDSSRNKAAAEVPGRRAEVALMQADEMSGSWMVLVGEERLEIEQLSRVRGQELSPPFPSTW